MIRAMIFDLDGTLVQTEKLKALSYAQAVIELCPHVVQEAQVVEAFKDVVGLSRKEVAEWLIERFNLADNLQKRMSDLGAKTPWQALIELRLRYYEQILADPGILQSNQWPHNMALLQAAQDANCRLGLATMSYCAQVQRILKILDLTNAFDFIATREDVEYGKPDPEIYLLVSRALKIPPEECLVIEDSPTGVQAAQAAGMWVIAVTTPFTHQAFRENHLLDGRWIVDDPTTLPETLQKILEEHNRTVHSGKEI